MDKEKKKKKISEKFYLNFNNISAGSNRNYSDIEMSTKKLIGNSSRYSRYLTNYFKMTQTYTYKLPHGDKYPIYKNHQLIPLNIKGYDYHSLDSNNDKMTISLNSNSIKKMNKTHKKNKSSHTFLTSTDGSSTYSGNKFKSNIRLRNKKRNPSDIFLLSDILFFNKRFENLEFNEKEIFFPKDEDHYEELVNSKVKFLKENKNENETNTLTQNFNEEDEEEIKLTLKSFTIEFININKSANANANINANSKKNFFIFPFAYLPIFYFRDFKNFRFVLLSLFTFKNNFETIQVNEEKMLKFIKFSSLFKTNEGGRRGLSHLLSSLTSVNSPAALSEKISESVENNGNMYSFIWNTPKETYQVVLKLPEICLNLAKYKKRIVSYPQKEFMLYLIEKNFRNWDFYVIRYLFTFKNFRYIIENCLSKSIHFGMDAKFSITDYETINGVEVFTIPKMKHVSLIDNTNVKTHFSYFHTEREMNNIYIVHSYNLKIVEFEKEFNYNFNFKQMKILALISQYQDLKQFIHKIIIKNSQGCEIKLNYDYFNYFDENIFKYELKELESGTIDEGQGQKKKQKKIFTLFQPFLEKIMIVGHDIESDTNEYVKYEIKEEGIRNLFKLKNKIEWCRYVCENEADIISPKENYPKENIQTSKYAINPYGGSNLFRKSLEGGRTPLSLNKLKISRYNTRNIMASEFMTNKNKFSIPNRKKDNTIFRHSIKKTTFNEPKRFSIIDDCSPVKEVRKKLSSKLFVKS